MKKIVSLILVVLTVFAGTVHATPTTPYQTYKTDYNYDGHYWTVYLVATLLNMPEARELAFYAELPDHVTYENGMQKRSTMTWLNVFMQGKVHALTGKNPEKEHERSRKMYANAKTMKEKGRALHRLGDSYAHMRSDGSRMYGRGIGHAFAPEGGHEPDMIRNYPDKYLTYVRDLTQLLGGPNAQIDMTAFEYIAKTKLETEDNIEILKAEIAIHNKTEVCEINRNQSKSLQAYLDYRAAKAGFTCQMTDVVSKKKKLQRAKVTFSFPSSTDENKSGQ